jgi:hypothetical protein
LFLIPVLINRQKLAWSEISGTSRRTYTSSPILSTHTYIPTTRTTYCLLKQVFCVFQIFESIEERREQPRRISANIKAGGSPGITLLLFLDLQHCVLSSISFLYCCLVTEKYISAKNNQPYVLSYHTFSYILLLVCHLPFPSFTPILL